jgi:hypothetical protein
VGKLICICFQGLLQNCEKIGKDTLVKYVYFNLKYIKGKYCDMGIRIRTRNRLQFEVLS